MKTKQLLNSLFRKIKNHSFEVVYWDMDAIKYGNSVPEFKLIIKSENSVLRVFKEGQLGFGEEYMKGNIDVKGDLKKLVAMAFDPAIPKNIKFSIKDKLTAFLTYLKARNTIYGAKRNISHHYDLGNDFYALWLDKSMTYSCAYFKTKNNTLETAQQNKYEYLCRKLLLKKGETLIDIGCGWGGMLFYAARKYGVKTTGYTLSKQQYVYVLEQIRKQKLEDHVKIFLKDYREAKGKYDKFISIGMFEHVGKEHYPIFFKKTNQLLKQSGIGVLHTIGRDRETTNTGGKSWIAKYIFPGGYLPTPAQILKNMAKKGLCVTDLENLRLQYTKTLNEWSKRYESNVSKLKNKFNETFIRMWRLYLNSCSAVFEYGPIRLYQIIFTKGLNNDMPLTRDYLYKR